MATPDYFKYINKYVLVPINAASAQILQMIQKECQVEGTQIVGVIYLDHSAGLSLNVETFCDILPDGAVRDTGGPRAQNRRWILRYSSFKDFEFRPLELAQAKLLNLPEEIGWLQFYRQEGDELVEPLREL